MIMDHPKNIAAETAIFFSSASLQDLVRRFVSEHGTDFRKS